VLSLDLMLRDALKGNRWEVAFERDVWEAVPRFTYEPPRLGWALGEVAGAAAVLGGWLLIVGLLVWAGARRLVRI